METQLIFSDYQKLQYYFRHPSQRQAINDYLMNENLRVQEFQKTELRQKLLFQLNDATLAQGFNENSVGPVSPQMSNNGPDGTENAIHKSSNNVEDQRMYKTFDQISKEREGEHEMTEQVYDHYKPQEEVKEYVFEDPYTKNKKKKWE